MYHWPVTSAIIGITFNLCVVFFTLSLSFYHNFFVDASKLVKYFKVKIVVLDSFNFGNLTNFFYFVAVPLQIVRDHLRKLETKTDQFLKDHSILTGER